jgi:hypothetical protein
MTPEQLDEARAREACRRILPQYDGRVGDTVDLDLLAVRQIYADWLMTDPAPMPKTAEEARSGSRDNDPLAQAFLAAIKRGRELAQPQPQPIHTDPSTRPTGFYWVVRPGQSVWIVSHWCPERGWLHWGDDRWVPVTPTQLGPRIEPPSEPQP